MLVRIRRILITLFRCLLNEQCSQYLRDMIRTDTKTLRIKHNQIPAYSIHFIPLKRTLNVSTYSETLMSDKHSSYPAIRNFSITNLSTMLFSPMLQTLVLPRH